MSLTRDDVKRAAALAHVAIEELEVDETLQQLGRIFGMIEEMTAVDVAGVEPMSHPQDLVLRLREDVVTEPDQHELLLSIAPRVHDDLYLVPKVLE